MEIDDTSRLGAALDVNRARVEQLQNELWEVKRRNVELSVENSRLQEEFRCLSDIMRFAGAFHDQSNRRAEKGKGRAE